ncbi:MAG: DUF262 domain-containing HNH endonuclease family protein [Deferrisomatales bacterium]|nr:DUF262 domain-containing HNH endonuclease family protein [Deferrisomatales bacterium]
MGEQTIQSQDINVAQVFQSFYVVPDYQREYVWETDQVEQLLNDINAELNGADPKAAPEYFIGSVVVCPSESGVFELIDGQQRMTTLFILLCAIRDRIKMLGEKPPGALAPQIAAVSTDAAGEDRHLYRLDLQYEDSGEILVEIADEKGIGGSKAATKSIANMMNAYTVAVTFLANEFDSDPKPLRGFYGYLTNKVKLIRIETEDVAKALKIFETINDRGVGLNSMDLLKNLLFMKASRADFEKLKNLWKELQDTIFEMGEKPLRFLRYFIFSRYDVELLREDQIYSWFSKNEKICGYAGSPVLFAKELLESARAYRNILEGKDQRGAPNRYLENMRILGGKAARQHLILLLAGRHLADELFYRLAREVENLFFVYTITREPTRDFEKNFAKWAIELRKISTEEELEAFVASRFRPAKKELSDRFDDAMRRLYSFSVQQYRLRYVLAKLTQSIDIAAYGEIPSTMWLSRYSGSGFEIEHIFPQNPCPEAEAEFGTSGDETIGQRIGNLALVEKSINASLGNLPYSKKRDIYKQSQLLLTRALAEKPKVGSATKIDKAVEDLEPFMEWNEGKVFARQEVLAGLARQVWDMPEKAGAN